MTRIKAILFAAILAVVPSVAVAADAEGNYGIFAVGNMSCAKYLQEYQKYSKNYRLLDWWLNGYMTASGVYVATEKSLSDVADHAAIEHLARNYCEENPLDLFADAAVYVARQLIDRAGRR